MSALPRVFALTATLVCLLFAPAHAEGVYFGLTGGPTSLPLCDAPSVQSAVRRTIARADTDYRGGISIEKMDLVGQTGYALDTPSPVARRYCRARAYLSNGRLHPVYYMIEAYSGFVGVSWNVEACLPGFDRWRVNDGNCRVVRR
ncbi:cytoplasmic protein [Breoghania sp. JC706]|uniref:cytoplasmic protein n=1 Tax=Breoghania sp. JC706 TaxID=3117732 RepID=UPI00300B3BDA